MALLRDLLEKAEENKAKNKDETTKVDIKKYTKKLQSLDKQLDKTKEKFKDLDFGDYMTLDDYMKFKASVKRNETCKKCTRDELLIKMYGHCIHPATGEPFSIPLLDITDKDYAEKYARKMFILDNEPQKFIKIINWD